MIDAAAALRRERTRDEIEAELRRKVDALELEYSSDVEKVADAAARRMERR